jgi:hypothetical protein
MKAPRYDGRPWKSALSRMLVAAAGQPDIRAGDETLTTLSVGPALFSTLGRTAA